MKKCLKHILSGVLFAAAVHTASAEQLMEMTVSTSRGTGDDPIIVVWAETDTGDFVRTLHIFSRDKEYYKDMLAWRFKSKGKEMNKPEFDAVCGATISWNRSKTITVPAVVNDVNLLDGSHVIRIESRQWKGKHFRGMKIPITKEFKGGVFKDKGYVKEIKIQLKEAKTEGADS